ncbi:5'-3' exonuclease [Actinoplanes sp. SE50]|uniref:5'-3' exonuclease n=1 Tax=unclassified Actinoplanes TaxID=2626549 RepID=UPI00023EC948|nr:MULTISPECIES: 5'-3' exonuclease [unclassified Actinoplanes]AEV83710.1 5'-3' exonuclease [Actinoplanes sp. SE50/110]ATO82146.1 5'-3' exonuclease [Actinoplanes sp. SE50]SLL99553.1 5'-3' exonuclease [Actinoplanes sp. SE50/110]
MTRPLLAVDAPSLYFRAFHGIPEKAAQTDAGEPVNAIRGFLDMIAQLVRTRRPDRLICALDADWRPAWRVELVPSYKAHRVAHDTVEEVPAALERQVPVLLEVLEAVGIPAFGVPGYEADDVLGTIAATQAAPVEVVSGDRDLFQLVDDARGTRLLYCGRGVAKLEDADEALVQGKYGVPARYYADFAAMRGDPSDGLPGVAGVGEKTAARLIERYGGIAEILAALDDPEAGFAPGVRTKLAAGRDYLAKALPVCRVALDVKLPDVDPALPREPRDPQALLALAERWNLAGSARRLVDALAG